MKETNTTDLLGLNFYQVTGVETQATFKEIKKAYIRFLKQKKQVENPSEKTEKLWDQTEYAYSILGNEYSKALYDFFGVDFLNLTDFRTIGYQSDETIEAIINQQLLPRADGTGLVPAFEILHSSNAIRNLIREGKTHQIASAIQTSKASGMVLMDEYIAELYAKHTITADTAIEYARDPITIRRKLVG